MKILLIGASGRLGQRIALKLSERHVDFEPVERIHTESSSNFKSFLERQGTQNKACLILDVSLPHVTHNVANFLCELWVSPDVSSHGLTAGSTIYGFMVGTTGHSDACRQAFTTLSAHLPVCLAPNFSKGIFFLGEILNAKLTHNTFAQLADKLGFTKTIHEVHHQHKKDAPSGTALWLAQHINVASESITALRTGEVIGEHSIVLQGENETLTLSHKSHSRDVYADGACDLSVRFFEKKWTPGLYSLSDIW